MILQFYRRKYILDKSVGEHNVTSLYRQYVRYKYKDDGMYIKVAKKEPDMKIDHIGNSNGKDYILFRVLKGTCLHDYAVYDTTYDEKGNISNKWRHFFRFPKGEIMAEDGYLCLYTDDSTSQASVDGRPIKTFHMGLQGNIFNEEGDRIYLIKVSDIDSKSY